MVGMHIDLLTPLLSAKEKLNLPQASYRNVSHCLLAPSPCREWVAARYHKIGQIPEIVDALVDVALISNASRHPMTQWGAKPQFVTHLCECRSKRLRQVRQRQKKMCPQGTNHHWWQSKEDFSSTSSQHVIAHCLNFV